jgi:threonine dehydrogenase-like Zn-dependent dehydrogenase
MSGLQSSVRAAYAKHILNEHLLKKYNATASTSVSVLPPAPTGLRKGAEGDGDFQGKICIIGAGAAGLNTAMMLKYLGFDHVDIYEASERIGGRAYTHEFDKNDTSNHNYYDVGAMRIPDIPWMKQ